MKDSQLNNMGPGQNKALQTGGKQCKAILMKQLSSVTEEDRTRQPLKSKIKMHGTQGALPLDYISEVVLVSVYYVV